MLSRVASSTLLLGLLALPRVADAMAAYLGLDGAIEQATTIALVRIDSVEQHATQGEHWVYDQRATAKTLEVLKGDPGQTFQVLADKDFVCAPAALDGPGVYLLMLRREGDAWTSINHGHGHARVWGGEVDWPYDEIRDLVPLADVVQSIRARVGAEHPPEPPRPEAAVTTPDVETPSVDATHEDAAEASLPSAAWIVVGAGSVLLGFAAATSRRGRR